MFETFIYFLSETNLVAAVSLCISFIILSLGILLPVINYLLAYVWSIIDESEIKGDKLFVDYVKECFEDKSLDSLGVYKHDMSYRYVIRTEDKSRWFYGGKFTDTCSDYYISRFNAESALEELKQSQVYYIPLLFVFTVIPLLLSIAFNYFLLPSVYVLTLIACVYGLRVLRRLQKKALELAEAFKKHTEDKDLHKK